MVQMEREGTRFCPKHSLPRPLLISFLQSTRQTYISSLGYSNPSSRHRETFFSVGFYSVISQVCREFSDNWELLPIEEHIALHESMMVLAVTGITTAHFGVYFKDGKKIPAFIQNYLMVKSSREILKMYLKNLQRNYCTQVWNEMEAKLAGDFTEDQKEREERLQANLKKFHEVCHDIIGVQKKARESGDYESAPFLNAVIDNSTDEQEEFSDSVAFMFGGFHSSGNLLTWSVNLLK